jgi:hypothetical protein
MKFVTMLVVFAALCGNAAAQTQTGSDANVDISSLLRNGDAAEDQTPAALPTVEQCLADLEACRQDIGAQTASAMDLLIQLAERQGYASVDDMLAADCRSRRGTWQGGQNGQGGQCLCAEPNHWFGTEAHPETCCVPSTHRYENQMHDCIDSGGNWSCRGGCRCPMGTHLLDGECTGDAATREEVDRLRNRIPELEAEVSRLQGELEAAQTRGDDLADRIAELERQLAAVNGELDNLRDLLALRETQLRDALGQVPPAPPSPSTPAPPAPLPGTAAAVAEAAGGTGHPGPLAPTPPPPEEGEEEGHFCNTSVGGVLLCYVLPVLAAGGLATGIACATGACTPNEARVNWYNR